MIQPQILADETSATPRDVALLELAAENADLRLQLAEAQEQCIAIAVDAGQLQAGNRRSAKRNRIPAIKTAKG